MNVFEIPSNGGGFVFGSPWGVSDLVVRFNDTAQTLSFAPNNINDPNPFWYSPLGGPGAVGNKRMEANLYQEQTNTLGGQTVQFSGSITGYTLASSHTVTAFIKDFAPDFSTFTESAVPVSATGNFSISLATDPTPGRHVQWGFQMSGPCVWITDAAQFGSVTISTAPPAAGCDSIDFNGDGLFPDDNDLVEFLTVLAGGECSTATCNDIDFNNDGLFPDDNDLVAFLTVLAGGNC
jgi:hypothetical protein